MELTATPVGPFTQYTFTKSIAGQKAGKSSVNVFRLGDILFDSCSQPAAPFLIDAMRDDPPRRIVLSHQHEDHIGGLGQLTAAWGGIPVHAPREHIDIIRDGFEVPAYRVAFWGATEGHADLIPFDAGATFESAGHTVDVIDTPGHTFGHKSFVLRHAGTTYVISGDLYLAPKLPNAWCETNVPDMIMSLERLLDLAPEFVLCPSHGGPFTDGAKRVRQLRDWYVKERDTIQKIHDAHPDADYNFIFRQRFDFYNPMEISSRGELSRAALIRGVIDPVRSLPATPIQLDEDIFARSKERLERKFGAMD